MADTFDRFRSFAERYVISRAANFRAGHEEEDGYAATLQARTIYNNIEVQSKSPHVVDNRPDPTANQSQNGATHAPGATGAMRIYTPPGQRPPLANSGDLAHPGWQPPHGKQWQLALDKAVALVMGKESK